MSIMSEQTLKGSLEVSLDSSVNLHKLLGFARFEVCPNCHWINNYNAVGYKRPVITECCHKCGMPRPEGGFTHVSSCEMSKLRKRK